VNLGNKELDDGKRRWIADGHNMCSAQKVVKFYCAAHNNQINRFSPVNRPVTATSYRQGMCCAGNGSFERAGRKGLKTNETGILQHEFG
jgi:hypothetical protein